jgi:alpha-ketoglutarate-dependent taurine dioxygenase
MSTMSTITVEKLGKVGARVEGVDVERLRDDDALPEWCHETLEANGVLVFPGLHVDDETQVAFTRTLGKPVLFHWRPDLPEIYPVTLDATLNAKAEYLRATVEWHIDGAQDLIPAMASLLSAKVLSETGGETEFASTYVAYEELTDDEKTRFEDVRVLHSLAGTQRLVTPDPTPEQEAAWAENAREHPLVWRHRSGRRSLVIGSTAVGVVGMDADAGAELLRDLLARATTPDHVFRHEWGEGDMVIWDNRGVIHRVQPYDPASGREMHRTTIEGDEPIQ